MRGRIHDLAFNDSSRFTLSCHLEKPVLTLEVTLEVKQDGALHLADESINHLFFGSYLPLYEVVQQATGMGTDLQVTYNNFAKGEKKTHLLCSDQFAVFTQLDSPAKFQYHHKKSQRQIPKATAHFRHSLSNILFLDPVPGRMRDYCFKTEKRLVGDGKNLSSVLFHLWGGDKAIEKLSELEQENRENILKFVRSLPEQTIKTLTFLPGPRDEVMVQLLETFGGNERECDASLLSDGTLRILAIAAAMLSAPENSMVVIEEIDNGVHPSRAAQLLAHIDTLAERRNLRVLLSSHNPALLDALPNRAIPNVVFCYRDPQDGSSRLVRLQNVPDYPELIAQGGIGHLMTTGVLEQFVKPHPGPEPKKKKSLDWLQQLRERTDAITREVAVGDGE